MRFGSRVHFLNKPLGGEVALREKRGWKVCEDGGWGTELMSLTDKT